MSSANQTKAKKKCPNLVPVHVATYKEGVEEPGYWNEKPSPDSHKVSLEPYRREGAKVLKCMQEIFVGCEIEKASIDEQYIDLTELVRNKILERYPFLKQLPPDKTLDDVLPEPPIISFADVGNVIPTSSEKGSDGEIIADEEMQTTWEDVAIQVGAQLVAEARKIMFEKIGYTCSAGISHNKILAKLCSAYKKPDDQTVLRRDAVDSFLGPMSFQKIRSLGGKFGEALAAHYDAATVSDLWKVPLGEMQRQFGEESIWIYNTIRGINSDEVKERVITKSMLASKSLRPPINTVGEVRHWLKILSSELSQRLKEVRGEEGKKTMWPKSIVLSMNQVYQSSRSHQGAFPYNNSFGPELIQKHAEKLLKEFVRCDTKEMPDEHKLGYDVNKLALSFSGLATVEARGIEGFLGQMTKNGNDGKLKRQHSTDSTKADKTEKAVKKKKSKGTPQTGLTAFLTKPRQGQEKPKAKKETIEIDSSEEDVAGDVYNCKECGKKLNVAEKVEHLDWHYAKLFKRDKSKKLGQESEYSESVTSFKDKISQPSPLQVDSSDSSAKMSVKEFKRRSSNELLGNQNQPQPLFKTRRKPAPKPNMDLSNWHTSDDDSDDNVRDNDEFEKFKQRIRQSRSTIRQAATTIQDNDSDESDDTLPLSQLRSKSQVSLVNSIASKPNKSTPSLKLQGSSHKLNYRKPPPPVSANRDSRSIKHNSQLSPNYQRQSHASYSPQSRQSTLRPPPSPAMSLQSAPGGFGYFNPYSTPGMPGMPPMPPMPPVGMPGAYPFAPPPANNLPTPPPSAPSSSNGDLNQQAMVAAQMHFQAMMNAKQSFQAYVAQHAAYLAGQQWDEEHSQYGGSEAGFDLNDDDYYLKGNSRAAKSDYGGISPGSANSRRSSNYLQAQQAQARSQMRYSEITRKAPSRESLKAPPPPPTIKHYKGQSSTSSIPKNPTKLRSQSTLSMR
ncbi:DNA/RNA polymerase [Wallemia mellicola]|nr:DNA/RNA polymerase [Wallemia mellicola]